MAEWYAKPSHQLKAKTTIRTCRFDPRCPTGQLGFNDVRGGSIREPLSTQTEQRVANRGAPIRTPCRVTSGHQQPMIHHQRSCQRGIKVLEAAKPDAMHPLQIQLDSLAGNVSIHPVPPDPRARTFGGIFESALERIGSALRRRADRSQQYCDAYGNQLLRWMIHLSRSLALSLSQPMFFALSFARQLAR